MLLQLNRPFWFFCLALLLRLSIAAQDITFVDRLFLPDDTYYILAISENIYLGNGPSTDGIIQSNGFQPLITLFQVPLFYLSEDRDFIASMAIFESAFFGALSTILIGLITLRIAGTRASSIAMGLWAFSPGIIQNDVNGLETSLSGLVCLMAIYQCLKTDAQKTTLNLSVLGIVCGLAILTRVDSCFLIILIGLFSLIKWKLKKTLIIVSAALIVVTPWWLYSYINFGNIVPESGKAVKQIIDILVTTQPQSSLVPLFALVKLTEVFTVPGAGMAFKITSTVLMVIMLLHGIYQLFKIYRQQTTLMISVLSGLILLLFYILYFPAYWFYERYFYWIYAVSILLIALLIEQQLINSSQTSHRLFKIPVYIYASYLLLTAFISMGFYFSQPGTTPKINLSGAKGYRDVALQVLDEIPANTTLGASQSGAINYYSGSEIRVINLDGVVNKEAYQAISNKTMHQYMKDNNIRYFADWEASLLFMQKVSNDKIKLACADTIMTVPQGFMNYSLYDLSKCMKTF